MGLSILLLELGSWMLLVGFDPSFPRVLLVGVILPEMFVVMWFSFLLILDLDHIMSHAISSCECSSSLPDLPPRVPVCESRLREYGIKPCYIRLNYIGPESAPGSIVFSMAKKAWECMLCLETFDFAEELHTHVRVIHALMHDLFLQGFLPCLRKCQFCR
jgi:hypothetical protein